MYDVGCSSNRTLMLGATIGGSRATRLGLDMGNTSLQPSSAGSNSDDAIAALEAALAHSRELTAYLVHHARSAVAVHDRDLRYMFVSQRYLEEYGVEDADIIGKHHYDVFPDLPQKWRDVHQRVLAGEILSADEDRYERHDGTVYWTRWECRPWWEADGSIGGIIIYTQVINELIRDEERLIRYQVRLRNLAAELVASSDREQRRLAVELHDGVGQILAAAKMHAQLVASQCSDGAEESAQSLLRLLDQSISEIRTLMTEMAPTMLLDQGLESSLRWLTVRYRELYDLDVDLSLYDNSPAPPHETTMFVFRMVRELLNNVVRHSSTQTARVNVERRAGLIICRVEDDGEGFEPSDIDSELNRRFGLFSIREECFARGASLEIESSPGNGARITARVPDGTGAA